LRSEKKSSTSIKGKSKACAEKNRFTFTKISPKNFPFLFWEIEKKLSSMHLVGSLKNGL